MKGKLQTKKNKLGLSCLPNTITFPVNLVLGSLLSLIGLILLFNLDTQISIGDHDVVSGRAFPRLLLLIILACSAFLIIRDAIKLYRKEELEYKTISLEVELRAFIIFLILVGTYLIAFLSDLFILGALFCVFSFLGFFKCRKLSYYLICLTAVSLIWAAFYFGLKVRF